MVIHNYIFFSCTLETKKYVKVRDVNTSVNEPLLAEKARYFVQQLDYENVPANGVSRQIQRKTRKEARLSVGKKRVLTQI